MTVREGTIRNATWHVSQLRLTPYILLDIRTRRYSFHGIRKREVIAVAGALTSPIPGVLAPIERLQRAAGVEIQVGTSLTVGQKVPELIGKQIAFDCIEEEFNGTFHLRVINFRPPEEQLVD